MNIYTKQPISIDDQIAKLRSLGLIIADEDRARKTLSEVSYFRFAAYLRPMEADKQTHQFKPSSTLARLYGAGRLIQGTPQYSFC